MKNPEEWSKEFGLYYVHMQGADESYYRISPNEVKRIQADALRHAANLVSADWATGGSAEAVAASVKFLRKQAVKLETQ